MNYQDSLEFLYGLQRFGIKLGLENIHALLERLGSPQDQYRIIHVAGTNGKGSVSAALAQILCCAGYRVGLYTSPHLHSFTERIQVNGSPVSEPDVVRLTSQIRDLAGEQPATFFEFTTAMALLYFKQQDVDYTILEVGMGGRLDATNAVSPHLCVITPVGFDHSEYLGPDLATIAGEKAGILKPAVPVVVGRQNQDVQKVLLQRAQSLSAPSTCLSCDFRVEGDRSQFTYRGKKLLLENLSPGLPGRHQHDNLGVALAAAEELIAMGADISRHALVEGVARVRWPGRLEWWQGRRKVLLDGAHNDAGAKTLADYLQELAPPAVRWVVGLKGDKIAEDILRPVLPWVSDVYATHSPVEEAVSPGRLVELAHSAGVNASSFDKPEQALEAALKDRCDGEVVLVAGSLYLVAAAREYLMAQEADSL